MLSEQAAAAIVKKSMPDGNIQAVVSYQTVYIFQIFTDDPDEGEADPFYSVNKETGEFRDFSIFDDGNMAEIMQLFRDKKKVS